MNWRSCGVRFVSLADIVRASNKICVDRLRQTEIPPSFELRNPVPLESPGPPSVAARSELRSSPPFAKGGRSALRAGGFITSVHFVRHS